MPDPFPATVFFDLGDPLISTSRDVWPATSSPTWPAGGPGNLGKPVRLIVDLGRWKDGKIVSGVARGVRVTGSGVAHPP